MGRHRVVLHGHEESVQNNTDGDGQIHKRVHNDQVHNLLDLQPHWTALPNQECVSEFVPAWRTLALGLL